MTPPGLARTRKPPRRLRRPLESESSESTGRERPQWRLGPRLRASCAGVRARRAWAGLHALEGGMDRAAGVDRVPCPSMDRAAGVLWSGGCVGTTWASRCAGAVAACCGRVGFAPGRHRHRARPARPPRCRGAALASPRTATAPATHHTLRPTGRASESAAFRPPRRDWRVTGESP